MANKAIKTEHTGAKHSRGGYAGCKRDAKHESNKLRRRQSQDIIAVAGKSSIS